MTFGGALDHVRITNSLVFLLLCLSYPVTNNLLVCFLYLLYLMLCFLAKESGKEYELQQPKHKPQRMQEMQNFEE